MNELRPKATHSVEEFVNQRGAQLIRWKNDGAIEQSTSQTSLERGRFSHVPLRAPNMGPSMPWSSTIPAEKRPLIRDPTGEAFGVPIESHGGSRRTASHIASRSRRPWQDHVVDSFPDF